MFDLEFDVLNLFFAKKLIKHGKNYLIMDEIKRFCVIILLKDT